MAISLVLVDAIDMLLECIAECVAKRADVQMGMLQPTELSPIRVESDPVSFDLDPVSAKNRGGCCGCGGVRKGCPRTKPTISPLLCIMHPL